MPINNAAQARAATQAARQANNSPAPDVAPIVAGVLARVEAQQAAPGAGDKTDYKRMRRRVEQSKAYLVNPFESEFELPYEVIIGAMTELTRLGFAFFVLPDGSQAMSWA